MYPEAYLGDATMAARNANRRSRCDVARPGRAVGVAAQIFGQAVQEPQSAFGPMGGTGEENVSVIVSRSPPGASGWTASATRGTKPSGSWPTCWRARAPAKPPSCTSACARATGSGATYYTFEYTIRTDTWYRHNVAVFAEFGAGCTRWSRKCGRRSGKRARRISKPSPSRSACSCPRGDAGALFSF